MIEIKDARPLFQKKKPISLYFHIPFCTKKCSYCHFFVLPDKKNYHLQLLEAISQDISNWEKEICNCELVSIYFGGGTPSLLEPSEIDQILKFVHRIIPFNKNQIEITLEANPETINLERMKAFADIGINRLSIGVQTLDDALLKKLGRTHSAKTSIEAINIAKFAGIHNISIDLMYDIPGQTLMSWSNTLDAIRDMPITHLSLYNLTIEPHTVFFKYQESLRKELPDADSSTAMYREALEKFKKYGLLQYEISAFAKGNQYSRHNIGYWTGRPFLGFGPSAFSYWEGSRFRAYSNLNKYHEALQKGISPLDFTEKLEPRERRLELLTIRLRLNEGVDLKSFEDEFGCLSPDTKETIQKLKIDGFLINDDNNIKLSDRGILFYDTVASELI